MSLGGLRSEICRSTRSSVRENIFQFTLRLANGGEEKTAEVRR